jgi:hypothetical protein
VHLAGAEASGCQVIVSGDRELCRASLECGFAVLDLTELPQAGLQERRS